MNKKSKSIPIAGSSIAGRINLYYFLKNFWSRLGLFFSLFLLFSVLFLYAQEKNLLGENWTIKLERQFEISKDEGLNFYQQLGSLGYSLSLPTEESTGTSAESDAEDPAAIKTAFINLAPFAQSSYIAFWIYLVMQLLSLSSFYIQGKDKTKELLAPLHQMAETAHEMSQVSFDEAKYHDLESAIDQISPLSPESKLHTGDKELAGLEMAVNKLLTRMHQSYQQQARFVSDASHELRTPIAVIQGYADLLARWGKEDEKVMQESIDAIQSESRQMKVLVDQLLFLARGDAGRHQMKMQIVNLSNLMKELGDEYAMIQEDFEWDVNVEEYVPVLADYSLLKQAVRILCDNAAKYSTPGTKIKLRAYRNSDNESCLFVQDSGQGISKEDASRIFDRFYRADPARSREKGGTGLGLSIAKWIVDQHQGYFRLISSLGVGSRFSIHLPFYEETKLAPTEEASFEASSRKLDGESESEN